MSKADAAFYKSLADYLRAEGVKKDAEITRLRERLAVATTGLVSIVSSPCNECGGHEDAHFTLQKLYALNPPTTPTA